MEQSKVKNTGTIPGLDGLRAVAITGIVFYHMFPQAIRGGYLGVSLFFVLSGYLMAVTALRAEAAGGFSAGRFYLRRLRRIYPALLLVLALTLLALRLLLPAALQGMRGEVGSVLLGYGNWRQILQNSSYFTRISNTSPLTHLWSLAVELQYYLLWPVLFWLYRAMARRGEGPAGDGVLLALAIISAVAMGMLYPADGDPNRVYYGTDTRAHALLLGSALGLLRAPGVLRLSKRAGAWLFAVCSAGVLALMVLLDGSWRVAYYGLIPLAAVLFSVLVCLCADEHLPIGRWLNGKPLVWLGLWLFQRLQPVENDPWLLAVLELAVILVVSALVHAVTSPKALEARAGEPGWKYIARPAFWLWLVLAAAGVWVLYAAPADAGDTAALEQELELNRQRIEEPAETEPVVYTDPAAVTMVGDSVMLGALPALETAVPGCVVDAKVSRQVWDAQAVLDHLESSGQLGSTVVLALGTNGTFSQEQGQALLDRLGPDRQVYWVTAYGAALPWQEQSNDAIRALAASNDNVTLIDWSAIAPGHDSWFYSDGIHLQSPGQDAYAAMIAEAIGIEPQTLEPGSDPYTDYYYEDTAVYP